MEGAEDLMSAKWPILKKRVISFCYIDPFIYVYNTSL